MIRLERDPAFWTAVAAHPAVIDAIHGMTPEDVGAVAERGDVLPFAATHGGFLVAPLDALGFARDMHVLFTPEGWGREASTAFVQVMEALFWGGTQVVNVYEIERNRQSRPGRTAGWVLAGDWRETAFGRLRLWVLTKRAWETSIARKRLCLP